MDIGILATTPHQMKWFGKVAESLRAQGVSCRVHPQIVKAGVVACWGWRRGRMYREAGREVLVFERGYLGDRFHWTSVAWNGLNGHGDFCLPEQVSGERFNAHFSMKPWKKDGKHIVIMGQVRGDASLAGADLTGFYEKMARKLRRHYDRPVTFRPHPLAANHKAFRPAVDVMQGTLEEALADAFLAVTFNSNSAVDAIVAGIPTLSFDKGCMAHDVTGHDIEERIFPDRTEWAARLAHCQWSPQEIESAAFWERMRGHLDQRQAA